jgi:release factor glutamine methyltransferase
MTKDELPPDRIRAWLVRDKYAGDNQADLTSDLARIKSGEPLDYVIGWSEFLGCRIDLAERPLIPRAETEFWTKQAIEQINACSSKPGSPGPAAVRCLDIFAGSGCIGIAVLKHCPQARVHFIEQDERFCAQIRKNLNLNGIVSSRAKVLHADIFNLLRSSSPKLGKYDLILANPPYVPRNRRSKLDRSVTDWEPATAIFAEDGGLSLIKRFIEEVRPRLARGGQVWLEFDSSQKMAIERLLKSAGFLRRDFGRDQYGRARFVIFA